VKEPNPRLTITCSVEGEDTAVVATNLASLHAAIRDDQGLEPHQYRIEYTAKGKTFKIKNENSFEAFSQRPRDDGEYEIVLYLIEKDT